MNQHIKISDIQFISALEIDGKIAWKEKDERESQREREREWEGNAKSHYENGRVLQNVTTFFISHFLHGHTKRDLWRIFQRFERIHEVVIARRTNKWGHRFEFVRFFDVKNQRRMEYKLDQIRIGDRKLYANLPRFQRSVREKWKPESVEPSQEVQSKKEGFLEAGKAEREPKKNWCNCHMPRR